MIYHSSDSILGQTNLPVPCPVSINIADDQVTLAIGPRDITWDRKSGKETGSGMMLKSMADKIRLAGMLLLEMEKSSSLHMDYFQGAEAKVLKEYLQKVMKDLKESHEKRERGEDPVNVILRELESIGTPKKYFTTRVPTPQLQVESSSNIERALGTLIRKTPSEKLKQFISNILKVPSHKIDQLVDEFIDNAIQTVKE